MCIRDRIIVDQNIYEALFNERKMIKNWSKSNPEDSKSYDSFRNGIIYANPKTKLFKDFTTNNILEDSSGN